VIWAPALNAFGAMSIEGANQALFRSADGETWTRAGNAPCYAGLASSGKHPAAQAQGLSCAVFVPEIRPVTTASEALPPPLYIQDQNEPNSPAL
jgi:hypothetical protein